MGIKTKELIETLEELIYLLEGENEGHWSMWFKKSKLCIENSDYYGVKLVLNAYGGMGSFSDLVICQSTDGGSIEFTDDHKNKNERMSALRSKVWELADGIKHDQV